jgi:Fe-S cluster biogenesis protein NfuA
MFIQTEQTPNPATLKFLPGTTVLGSGSADYSDAASAGNSPLATKLFAVSGVASVYLGSDFITVGKADQADWAQIKPYVLGAIMDHYASGQPAVIGAETDGDAANDDPIVTKIKQLIDTRVRPAVAQDGGDITFKSFEDGVVSVYMKGSCSGCPSSTATLKNGIENMLKYYVPEVTSVISVDQG